MDRECIYCKKDWKTTTDNPFISDGLVFCDKNCAIDYLFKKVNRLRIEVDKL